MTKSEKIKELEAIKGLTSIVSDETSLVVRVKDIALGTFNVMGHIERVMTYLKSVKVDDFDVVALGDEFIIDDEKVYYLSLIHISEPTRRS